MKAVVMFMLCSVVFGLMARPIPLHCWVVRSRSGVTANTYDFVTNKVEEANRIFSQVALRFEVATFNYTNDTRYLTVSFTNTAQHAEIFNMTNVTSGLEVYFVDQVIHGAVAFHSSGGIVIGHEQCNQTTLAHELGHACGLADIYDQYEGTGLVVSGPPEKGRFTHDWGWFPPHVTQVDLVQRLLMYGYNTNSKADISRGDVYGLYYTYEWNSTLSRWDRVWHLGLAPVGFKLHGTRHPQSH